LSIYYSKIPLASLSTGVVFIESGLVENQLSMARSPVIEPFPISVLAGCYLIFDVDVVLHLRENHRLCGNLIGNIPQSPQQNVFSGIPLELMPEEAHLLLSQGHAYLVDDTSEHERQVLNAVIPESHQYRRKLYERGFQAANAARDLRFHNKAAWAAKSPKNAKLLKGQMSAKRHQDPKDSNNDDNLSNYDIPKDPKEAGVDVNVALVPHRVTPTTSNVLIPRPSAAERNKVFDLPSSHHLFEYLHSRGYYLLTGMRFGCQYTAYLGDPLRFHSHFLVTSKEWDEPIDLLDIIGGGRLGTGVKKGYLIGGVVNDHPVEEVPSHPRVRTFCFEWAAM